MGFSVIDEQSLRHPSEPETAPPRLDFVESGYRTYSPTLARWLSRDPAGESGFDLISNIEKNEKTFMLEIVRDFLVSEGFDVEYGIDSPLVLRQVLAGIKSDPVAFHYFFSFAAEHVLRLGKQLPSFEIRVRESRAYEGVVDVGLYVFVFNDPVGKVDALGLKGISIPPGFGISPPTDWKDPKGFSDAVKRYVCDCRANGEVSFEKTCLDICDALWGKSGGGWVSICSTKCMNCTMHEWNPFKKKQKKLGKK